MSAHSARSVTSTLCAPILISLVLARPGLGATPDGRFDHASQPEHAANCNDCHRLGPGSQWEQKVRVAKGGGTHAVCTKCHQEEWATFDPRKGSAVCAACHAARDGRLDFKKVVYPPYRHRDASQFTLAAFSHADHLREGNRGCAQCHVMGAKGAKAEMDFGPVGHETCGNQICHGERVSPKMSECEGCHRLGKRPPPAPADVAFRVDAGFGHDTHAKAAKDAQCGDCHTNVAVGAGQRIPRPEMIACESCHDGAKAFSALGAQCMRCHAGKQSVQVPVEKPKEPVIYTHALHQAKGVPLTCDKCHPSAPSGRIEFPVPNKEHKPCATCHAVEFRKKNSTLCFTCHAHNQPWRPNPTLATFSGRMEFGVSMKHAAHSKVTCDACHFAEAGKPPEPAPPGLLAPSHRLCARCHESLQKPMMTSCGECHALEAGLGADEGASGWSVRATFSHDLHRKSERTEAFECGTCHAGTAESNGPPPHPTKASCETCHTRGEKAFGVTGFQCYRCHGTAAVKATNP
ncbi:MAG: hypothetical protein H6730_15405 [Deltaproteobacteria bacterium]|nr:hypothetical protein [Deltaproteobacteria bacterium]